MKSQAPGAPPPNAQRTISLSVVLLLLFVAAAFLAAGVLLGENGLVQRNAHYLCLDCIGIG